MNHNHLDQVWDDELARVAQKWADQCADVDYLVRAFLKLNFIKLTLN